MADESLADFIAQVSGDQYLRVEQDLGDGFVRLRVGEAERRQARHDIRHIEDVVVELLRNSRDAGAASTFVALSREGSLRTITVVDDGSGVPDGLRDAIFQPRVTSKLDTMVMDDWGVHGRGMALYSIRSNAESARVVESGIGLGTSIQVACDLTRVPERADQATLPTLEQGGDGQWHVARGPHNALRQAAEIELASPRLAVYVGTPAEILATMVDGGRKAPDSRKRLSHGDIRELPLWLRPATAESPLDLARIGDSIGLSVSERTARRVISGDIRPLATVVSRATRGAAVSREDPGDVPQGIDLARDRRRLKFSQDDINSFKQALEHAFAQLGERYYVTLADSPKVSISGNTIRVRFDVEKEP